MGEWIFSHKTQTNRIKQKNVACLFPQQRPRELHWEVPAFQAGTSKVLELTLLAGYWSWTLGDTSRWSQQDGSRILDRTPSKALTITPGLRQTLQASHNVFLKWTFQSVDKTGYHKMPGHQAVIKRVSCNLRLLICNTIDIWSGITRMNIPIKTCHFFYFLYSETSIFFVKMIGRWIPDGEGRGIARDIF